MTPRHEPVAIVGIGCRFPGGADTAEAFWRLVRDGVDAIADIPEDRPELRALYDPRPGTPGRISCRQGGFLSRLELFDPAFFGISPREASVVDPQQRLLLETTWEALEDAGIVPAALAGRSVGVFVGMWTNEYEDRMFAASPNVDLYVTTGGGRYAASGRLSYTFDLRGPSLTLDTACSSSLVAVHLACQSLRAGECEMAVVGASNLLLTPQISVGYSRSRMLSPDGRCRFGDARASGYVRSEGVGVVVLQPLSRALAEGNRIHAVVCGSAVNNDGRSSGLLVAPGVEAQKDMLRRAYDDAGIDPASVGYVEAHGTGTGVGDPVELEALGAVLGAGRPVDQPCPVGSIKTNIGHAEAASGMAGLIKAALCLEHRQIPPSLHFETPNPKIPWSSLPLRIETRLVSWAGPAATLSCGVNSFGVTGTNAHLVLREAPPEAGSPAADEPGARLLPLSAATAPALRDAARAHHDWLVGPGRTQPLADVCYTAGERRTHHEHRLAVVGRSHEDVAARLEAFLADEPRSGLASGRRRAGPSPRVVFVFPGQGSQWLGMGRQLLRSEPAFRAAIESCDRAVRATAGWSILDEIHAAAEGSRLHDISVVQPTLFAMQVSLAATWRSWGIEPSAIVGHSMGEVAAAHVAGALSMDDAARVISRRSELMKRVSGRGAMAVVELSFDDAREAIHGFGGRLSVAVSNSSRSTVVSGDADAIDELLAELERRDVFARRVKVDVASHSPHMDPLMAELGSSIEGLRAGPAAVRLFSTVTGLPAAGPDLDAGYWVRNLREPVLFSKAVRGLAQEGHELFLEVSPHPVLVAAMQQDLDSLGAGGAALGSLVRDEDESISILAALGGLYSRGLEIDWARQVRQPGRVVSLPTYPWQRERHWHEPAGAGPPQAPVRGLLGPHLASSIEPGHFWESEIGVGRMPYLADHRVNGAVLFPAAAFCEMALSAVGDLTAAPSVSLEELKIEQALVLPATGALRVQVALTPAPGESWQVRISSRSPESAEWTLHARACARGCQPEGEAPIELPSSALAASDEHFRAMAARGLEYGPAFRALLELTQAAHTVWGRLALPEGLPTSGHRVHPSLLDAAFQLGVAALPADTAGRTWVPAGLRRLRWLATPPEAATVLWARAIPAATQTAEDAFRADVTLADATGRVLVEVEGLELVPLEPRAKGLTADAFHQVTWVLEARAESLGERPADTGSWLVLPDRRGLGARLAEALRRAGHVVRIGEPDDALDAARLAALLSSETGPQRLRGVVHLGSLDAPSPETGGADALEAGRTLTCDGPTRLVQALAARADGPSPRLWLVSANAQAVCPGEVPAVEQSPLWGLGRVAASEHPEFHCSLVDVSRDAGDVEVGLLVAELEAGGDEDQIGLRGPDRFVARLRPWSPPPAGARSAPAAGRAFLAGTSSPGILDGLCLREVVRRTPAAGEVEIRIEATGLNFMNVMSALGVCPGYPKGVGPLGIECAGKVTAVGDGVQDLQPGDDVLAVAIDCLASHTLAAARLVRRRPAGLAVEQAATLPIVYLTAHYALNHLARLRKGERVLIHAAAGGVGLAAIQIAHHVGAEVFATAGSPEKRSLVESMGVRHVMDSRSLAFRDQVLERTAGEGVDVVLNSLAGEFVPASLGLLRPYGRFLEIGKKDIYRDAPLGLAPFRRNLSYFAIDLDRMIREVPDQVSGLLDDVLGQVESGALSPVAVKAYPVSRMGDAFRDMAQARHTGKIAITLDDPDAMLEPIDAELTAFTRGTCLITGGLGALGLAVADRLADRGVPALVLAGRRPPTADAQKAIAGIERKGARVRVVQADVAALADARRLASEIDGSLPPLSGIVHAAGLLDDGILLQQTPERFARAMAPKVQGAWHAHELADSRGASLVLFSSAAALLGLSGQANYAAGNAFLDALARYREARGKPGVSINWGPWSGIGLAAAQANRGERLSARGLVSIAPAAGLEAFETVLGGRTAQVAVMPLDWPAYAAAFPAAARASLVRPLAARHGAQPDRAAEPAGGGLRESLRAVEVSGRRALLESFLQEQVAHVLKQARNRIDVHKPFRTLGLDSLMALELRNRLEAGTGIALPATLVWNYPTVTALAPFLAERLDVALDETRSQPQPADDSLAPSDLEALVGQIEQLSAEEARRLLSEES